MKRTVLIVLAIVAVLATVGLVFSHFRMQAEQHAAWERAKAERAAELDRLAKGRPGKLAPLSLPPVEPLPSDQKAATPQPPAQPVKAESQSGVPTEAVAEAIAQAHVQRGKVWQDPLAREALSYVGGDPDAEEIWIAAINNPDLPAKERQDLIEDLNEEGFADPKNLTPDDLPLILSRIALIETYAPDAMDDVNLAAFMEAYKDLINMANRLMDQ